MKIKKNYWKCTVDDCDFQTTVISEADLHSNAEFDMKTGKITREAHLVENQKGKNV